MKTKLHLIAGSICSVMTASALLGAMSVWADGTTIITNIPASPYLTVETTGTLTMQVAEGRDIAVQIVKQEIEGSDVYYQTTLKGGGTYRFSLDSCEYDPESKTDAASFLVTISDSKDASCTYSEELVVKDPGFYPNEISASAFTWNITAQESESQSHAEASTEQPSVVDGVWTGSRSVALYYLNYLLGDVTGDSEIDINDAYTALLYYSQESAGQKVTFASLGSKLTEIAAFSAADIDHDKSISIDDAYRILRYYATISAGGTPSWD